MKTLFLNLIQHWLFPLMVLIKQKLIIVLLLIIDWYHARFNVDFKLQLLADGGNVAANVRTGIVNSAFSLINNLNVSMNGASVYDCPEVNHATNIKNLLEYSKGYAESQGSNEFFYIDNIRDNGMREFTQIALDGNAQNIRPSRTADYNKGFTTRKALLVNNAVANAEIPLNRYGFFEKLHNELLPNTRIELKIKFESDANLIWRTGGNNCRIVITKFQLIVPRITFNAYGLKLYSDDYFMNKKWSYLREVIYINDSTTQALGNFRISTGINKPRHVFVFIIDDADDNNQESNKFLYNTFSPDDQSLNECRLVVGNGRDYPEVPYSPVNEPSRIFRDVMKYVHANSEYSHDTLLTRSNFNSIFSFVYFDLTKQSTDIRDGATKLTFHYKLSAATTNTYKIYALVLHEQDVELVKTSGKLILRSM